MADFFETKAGAYFLEKQFPKLLRELERIADALERLVPALPSQQVEVPEDFLEQLYYGNLEPSNEITGDDLRENLGEVVRLQDMLCSKLTGEQWELYEQLQALSEKRNSRETELGFRTGFRIAMQMMVAGLAPAHPGRGKAEE